MAVDATDAASVELLVLANADGTHGPAISKILRCCEMNNALSSSCTVLALNCHPEAIEVPVLYSYLPLNVTGLFTKMVGTSI